MKYKRLCIIFFLVTVSYVLLFLLDFFKKVDHLLNQWSYSFSEPTVDIFWRMFTLLGETETLAILSFLLVVFLSWQKKIHELILYLFLMSSGIFLTFTLKLLIQKERPGEIEYIDFLGFGENIISYSFPSGHAVKSLLLLGFLIWFIRNYFDKSKYMFLIKILLVMGIVLCGIGQVFLHEHYISDVIGGYLIGTTIYYFSLWMHLLWKDRFRNIKFSYRKAN